MGKILRVELTRGKISEEPINWKYVEKFVGGPGIAAKILYDEVHPWIESLDPLNRLIFSTGVLTGTLVPCVGRHFIITKSPLTGYLGEANAGGFWGAELKFAGYDMTIISGKSIDPVYIWINDGLAEIRDATSYWGMDAREVDRAIREDLGDDKIKVACIGQAGENLVRYASIMNDEASRAAGRLGVGAVMGFKNLKAIAVRGNGKVPVADEKTLRNEVTKLLRELKEDIYTQKFHKYGTPGGYLPAVELGDSPIKNWTTSILHDAENIGLPGGYEEILVGHRSCHNCPVACRTTVKVNGQEVEGIEYESLSALGGNCGITDINVLAEANEMCNIYGLDTISVGSVIAFAMECYEKGIITKKDTNGIELKFGNADAFTEIIRKIVFREGFGDILAEGTRRAAHIIGGGSEQYAMQVKGLELGMHDPRAFQAMALTYACSPTGGRHMEGETIFMEETTGSWYPELELEGLDRLSTERKAETAFKVQNLWMALSAAGYCLLACATGTTKPYTITLNLDFLNLVTGINRTLKDFMKAGERIFNVRKAFAIRHGATRAEDMLPERLIKEPIKNGPSKGSIAKLQIMLPEYYKHRGWNPKSSKPNKEKLIDLELNDIVKDLY